MRTDSHTLWCGTGRFATCGLVRPMICKRRGNSLAYSSEAGCNEIGEATPANRWPQLTVRRVEGKTWNHPVLVRDVLLVRNGEEMAAFRLAVQR